MTKLCITLLWYSPRDLHISGRNSY